MMFEVDAEGGVTDEEVEFEVGQAEGEGKDAAGDWFDDSRLFCIACPMKPPTKPAMMATRRMINASTHHRAHPLRVPVGRGAAP
jgi:hypothetical protein